MEKVGLVVKISSELMKVINDECIMHECSISEYLTNAVYNNRAYHDTLRQMRLCIDEKEAQKAIFRHYVLTHFMNLVEI